MVVWEPILSVSIKTDPYRAVPGPHSTVVASCVFVDLKIAKIGITKISSLSDNTPILKKISKVLVLV